MVTPYIVVLVWIICGGIAWRGGYKPQWQWSTLGGDWSGLRPLSIPFAFLVKRQVS